LLDHSMMPGGAWYNDHLEGLVVCTVLWKVVVVVMVVCQGIIIFRYICYSPF
jgi:hypothetical protein